MAVVTTRGLPSGRVGAGLVGNFVEVADILLLSMVHRVMAGEVSAGLHVVPCFVGHEAAFLENICLEDRRDISNRRAVDMEATGGAAAFNKGYR